MAGVEERNIAQGQLPLGTETSEYFHMDFNGLSRGQALPTPIYLHLAQVFRWPHSVLYADE
jgi:hypothetical protein